ncbi:polysaccharide biosynthesis tyrosine autokinase [Leptolyngbya boryana CZ1]|uniref:non-specific protein-tyrosine kinase n=1 Tax=Leptolyngbya boryana CZ1 TaxID=3060204 RepID=A0AA96WXL4_LEPBY|nr:polysaccharide biosynthesis tyrosine autokinase [Leptolyngbya boryana]WNZ47083.1 polysaccharide biosynthesis tyrosine autokinase [Leptolyngbya boryana CZ1]
MSTNPLSKLYQSEREHATPLHLFSLKNTESRSEVDLKKIWDIVQRRKLFVLVVALILLGATMAWSVSRKPVYMSTFRLLIEADKGKMLGQQASMGLSELTSSTNFTTLTQVLKSSQVLQPAFKELQKEYPNLKFDQFLTSLSVTRLKDTEILEVSYLDHDPNQGLSVVEKLSQNYLDYGEQLRSRNLQQGIKFVEKQLPGLYTRVNQIQSQLQGFRESNQIVNPEDRAKYLITLSSEIETNQKQTQAKLAESKALYATLRKQVGNTPEVAIAASALSESKAFQELRSQLQQVETQLSMNAERLTPDAPPVQALIKKRQGILAQMEREARQTLSTTGVKQAQGNLSGTLIELNRQLITVSNEINALEARDRSLVATARQLQVNLKAIPSLIRQDVDLQRELKVANDSLDRFLASRETLQIEAAQNTQPWQIISAPSQRPAPIFPSIPQSAALGALGSLFLSVLAALLVDKLDDVLYSAEDLKQDTKIPLLSVIPFYKNLHEPSLPAMSSLRNLPSGALAENAGKPAQTFSIDLSEDAAIFREAFRSLNLSLSMTNLQNPLHSIVVASALASDGKSTVAMNMALAAATMGQRVLLVDADLYRSKVHVYARVPNEQGLSQYLTSDAPLDTLIQQSAMEQNLFVLTAGKAQMDASRLLSSSKMKTLMEDLKEEFDLIIYDAPPVLGFSDSLILSGQVDGSVLVVGLGNTGRTALIESLRGLQMSGSPVLGIVANCLKPGTHLAHKYHEYVRRNYNSDLVETV